MPCSQISFILQESDDSNQTDDGESQGSDNEKVQIPGIEEKPAKPADLLLSYVMSLEGKCIIIIQITRYGSSEFI